MSKIDFLGGITLPISSFLLPLRPLCLCGSLIIPNLGSEIDPPHYCQFLATDSEIALQDRVENNGIILPISLMNLPKKNKIHLRRRGTAIVETNAGILIVEESNGVYSLPGGGVHKGESTEIAAIRELREETGLETVSINIHDLRILNL